MQHHVGYVAASHAAAMSNARVVAATTVRLHSVAVLPTCRNASPAIDVYRHTAFRTTQLAAGPARNGTTDHSPEAVQTTSLMKSLFRRMPPVSHSTHSSTTMQHMFHNITVLKAY